VYRGTGEGKNMIGSWRETVVFWDWLNPGQDIEIAGRSENGDKTWVL